MHNLTKRERLRRVVLLCTHFARNLAYYRAGHGRLTKTSPQFWITADGNFIDMAVIEWCKLLGDSKGKHHWSNVIADSSNFESAMLIHLGGTADELAAYVEEMRTYRDKFIAHLDDLRVMDVPLLDRALATVEFYHRYVGQHEAAADDLAGLPTDLRDYYDHCFDEAKAILDRCSP
jgi:hypothetical protein